MTIKNLFVRIKNKMIFSFGVSFPYSKVRCAALRALGHQIGQNVYFPADLIITRNYVYDRGDLIIEDNVAIGPRCTLVLVSHPNFSELHDKIELKPNTIKIGKNAWLGAGVIVMPGVDIGEGSIVGAGSVVTKNVPANSVVFGVPAVKIRDIE